MGICQTKPDKYACCIGCGHTDKLKEYQFFRDIGTKVCVTLCDACVATMKRMTEVAQTKVEARTQDLRLKSEYLALWENAVCELRHCVSNEYGEELCNKLENSMVSFARGEDKDKIDFTIGD